MNIFEWAPDHGCLTGDCPHERQAECTRAVEKHVNEIARCGNALFKAVEGALRISEYWLPRGSDTVCGEHEPESVALSSMYRSLSAALENASLRTAEHDQDLPAASRHGMDRRPSQDNGP